MATGSLMPNIFPQYVDANGNPYVGGKLYSFLAGTSTPEPVYTDSALTIAHANPIILNARGAPGSPVFLDAKSYKFRLFTAADVLVDEVDGVQAVHLNQSALGEKFYFGGDPSSPVQVTAIPSGAGVGTLHAGTRVMRLNSADLPAGTYVLEAMMLGNGGTLSAAIVNLSDGTPDTPLANGTLTSANTTGELVRETDGLTFALPGADKDYGIKTWMSAGFGFAWGFALRRIA